MAIDVNLTKQDNSTNVSITRMSIRLFHEANGDY